MTSPIVAYAGRLDYALKSLHTHVAQSHQNGSTTVAKPHYAPTEPHLRRQHGALEVQVQVQYRPGQAPTKATCVRLAFTTTTALPELNLLEGWLPVANLKALSALAGVQIVKLPDYGISQRTITTKGDRIIEAGKLRVAGLTGRGVTVGVMSGGIDGIQAAQDAGELPADIQVIGDDQGTGNAGVTTLEIVHGVAPDAKLAFCRVSDEAQLLQCVKQLKQAGAVVVVNDLTAIDNSFAPRYLSQFEALANQKALLWIDAGGDAGENTVNAPFTPVNFAFGANKSVSAMDFGKATGQASTPYDTITIAAGDKLQFTIWWDDDPGAKHPSNIYIIYLLDRNNNVLAHPPSSAINLSKPHFAGSWTNKTGQAQSVRIVVAHTQGSGDNRIGLWAAETSNGLIESPLTISTTMDLHAQNEAESVLSVGAVDAATPDTIEPYSSAGPTYIEWLYDASTGQYRKAQPPIQRVKPDLVAPDAVSVPTADKHLMNFAGTSAAAPYVAGAAALLESYGLSKAQVVMALEKSAIDLGKSGKDNVYGYGRIDVYKALETVDIPPEVSIMAPSKNIAIDVGTSVTFKGECASNKHTISAYAWDFANGQTSSKKAPGAITFQKAGNYTVELTCTDSTGIKNPEPATRVVTVQAKNNQPSPPPDPNPDHSGGGGAAGPLALLGLLLLGVPMLIWRRVWLEM